MRKQLVLLALLSVVVGGALAGETVKPKVAPLSASDQALKKCKLHDTGLQTGTATILYGDRGPIVDVATAQRAFPHARSHVFGGCVISSDSPRLQTVKFCPACRTAEKRWLAAHHLSVPTH